MTVWKKIKNFFRAEKPNVDYLGYFDFWGGRHANVEDWAEYARNNPNSHAAEELKWWASSFQHENDTQYDQSEIDPLVFELVRALEKRYNDFESESFEILSNLRSVREFCDTKSGFMFYINKDMETEVISIHAGLEGYTYFSFNEQEQQLILKTINKMDRQHKEKKQQEKKEKEKRNRESWRGKIDC